MSGSNETLCAGDRVAVERLEGWIPKSRLVAVIERVTKDAVGNEAFVLLSDNQCYGLTQRAPDSFLLAEMVIHEMKTRDDLMDPRSGLGFVRVTRC